MSSSNVFGQLLTLLLAEKAGLSMGEKTPGFQELEKFTQELTKKFSQGVGERGDFSIAEFDKEMGKEQG